MSSVLALKVKGQGQTPSKSIHVWGHHNKYYYQFSINFCSQYM